MSGAIPSATGSLRRTQSADDRLMLTSLSVDEEMTRQLQQQQQTDRPEISDHSSICSSQYSYDVAASPASVSPRTLTRPPVPSAIVVHGGSRLHGAVTSNNLNLVRSILEERHAVVDAQDGTESTPLFYCKTTAVLSCLLNAGASVNHKNKDGLTPLHRHAIMGRIAIVCALLEAGADDRLLCNRGRSVLDVTTRRLDQLGTKKGKQKLQAIIMVLQDPDKNRTYGVQAGRDDRERACCKIM